MNSTGIIRRVDELGRVSIPREICHNLGIEVGTPFEITVNEDNSIILKKHIDDEKAINLEEAVKKIEETLDSADFKANVSPDILKEMRNYWSLMKMQFSDLK